MTRDSREVRFAPESGTKVLLLGVFFFLALSGLALALPFIEPPQKSSDRFISLAALLFLPFAVLCFVGWRQAKRVYILDDDGIRVEGQDSRRVRWDQAADIDLYHPLAIAELHIRLKDARGRKLMTISTEHYANGGRDLTEAIVGRLPAIMDRITDDYLAGRRRWKWRLLGEVIKFEGERLCINLGKTRFLPLSWIRRVEWLPGRISGARQGFVLIEHSEGKIELPQTVPGIQFFLHALRRQDMLTERVNPVEPEPVRAQVVKLRRSMTSLGLVRLVAVIIIFNGLYHFVRSLPEIRLETAIEESGLEVPATITELDGYQVTMNYQIDDDIDMETMVHLRSDRVNDFSVGQVVPIKVHPVQVDKISFDGKAGLRPDVAVKVRITFGAFILLGVGLLAWSFIAGQRRQQELERLAAAGKHASVPREPVLPGKLD